MKPLLRFLIILALMTLLFTYTPGFGSQLASTSELPHAMPPNPLLYDRIKRGEVKLPIFMTNPTLAQSVGLEAAGLGSASTTPISGSIRVLAVAVDFSDKVHTVTASAFDRLIFAAPVNGYGSVNDYFNEISYGQVDIVTVNLPSSMGWVRAAHPLSYYSGSDNCMGIYSYPNNCQKLAEDIINAIDGVVDFSLYDNDHNGEAEPIIIIHSGTGAELSGSPTDIWSHSWAISNPNLYKDGVRVYRYTIQPEYWSLNNTNATTTDMTIGVYAHEMGHGYWNLPDLYDTKNGSEGIGEFDLMASGSWNGNLGNVPAWPSAWTRMQMGFATPSLIPMSITGQSIPQPYGTPSSGSVLKLTSPALHNGEYYLLENREKVLGHYDAYIPGSGLLIWHIDEGMDQNNDPCASNPQSLCNDAYHYLVALMQADSNHNLENGINRGDAGDPYPGTSNKRSFTNSTNPDSGSWYAAGDSGLRVTNISNAGSTMTADITIPIINTAPVAVADSYTVNEDTTLAVAAAGILANDTDADGDPLTAYKVSSPYHGSLDLSPDGSFNYTPDQNWNGIDKFTYKVNDGKVYSNTTTVTITVKSTQDAPVAANDSFTTMEDTTLNVSAPGILSNDSDRDGNALMAIKLTDPAHGSVTINENGSISYIPEANWNGTDTFTYKANDWTSDSNVATVSITVKPVNDPPVTVNDAYSTDEDTTFSIAAPGVMGNDIDIEGSPLTATKLSNTLHGTVAFNANGSFTYRPFANWSGTDRFTYKVSDGSAQSGAAAVTITVNAVNDAPVAVNNSYATNEDTTLNISAPGLLGNDTDVEHNRLVVISATDPAHGTLIYNDNGSFSYTPDANYNGLDRFTYKASDSDNEFELCFCFH